MSAAALATARSVSVKTLRLELSGAWQWNANRPLWANPSDDSRGQSDAAYFPKFSISAPEVPWGKAWQRKTLPTRAQALGNLLTSGCAVPCPQPTPAAGLGFNHLPIDSAAPQK